MVIQVIKNFFLCSSVYSCYLFLISSAFVRPLPFLFCIHFIFPWNVPLISPIFLKRSPVFPILLSSSISLHCSFQKAFLPLLDVLWNFAFSWVYPSLSPLPFLLLPFAFAAICKPPYVQNWLQLELCLSHLCPHPMNLLHLPQCLKPKLEQCSSSWDPHYTVKTKQYALHSYLQRII